MIKIENLGFGYRKDVPVLKNISMTLEDGKIYGLLGENGVGKTTLLTLLCGLKKVNTGVIDVDGQDPFKRLPSFLQNLYYLPEDHKMNKMSAGQLKKTYISFALACNTKYLFLDEPTNGLDIPSKTQFRSSIMKYTADDATIVISTHQVRDLENIIDPIVILDRQDVLLNASIEEISDKLFFDYGTELKQGDLHSEQLPGGFIQVYPNTTGQESKVNIEALFNAVHNHKDLVKGLFQNK